MSTSVDMGAAESHLGPHIPSLRSIVSFDHKREPLTQPTPLAISLGMDKLKGDFQSQPLRARQNKVSDIQAQWDTRRHLFHDQLVRSTLLEINSKANVVFDPDVARRHGSRNKEESESGIDLSGGRRAGHDGEYASCLR